MPNARPSRWHAALVITLVIAATAPAQDTTGGLWQPVDQTVSDLDLRAASTRYVEQGIAVFGQSGGLYQRSDTDVVWNGAGQPLNQDYQLRQPGFTAWIDRPDYLVVDPLGETRLNVAPSQDRRFVDLIPPNTVFDLVPPSQRTFVPLTDDQEAGWDFNRFSTRIDGEITGEVIEQPAGMNLTPPPVAHRLPPHLIAEREARRRQANERVFPDEPTPESQDSDSADTPE